MPTTEPGWYLVKTKPLCEERVLARLSGAGFGTLFPRILRKVRGRVSPERRPLFPTYLFVRFSLEQFRLIRYTQGVSRVVSFGADPHPVEPSIVESVRSRMDDEGIVRLLRRPVEWDAGQKVTIGDGPFAGIDAIFVEELPERERVVLLLDAVSRFRVTVPKDSIGR